MHYSCGSDIGREGSSKEFMLCRVRNAITAKKCRQLNIVEYFEHKV